MDPLVEINYRGNLWIIVAYIAMIAMVAAHWSFFSVSPWSGGLNLASYAQIFPELIAVITGILQLPVDNYNRRESSSIFAQHKLSGFSMIFPINGRKLLAIRMADHRGYLMAAPNVEDAAEHLQELLGLKLQHNG
jgi:hypothetical protein